MRNNKLTGTVFLILLVILAGLSCILLGSDADPFLRWWLMSILLGFGYYPLGAVLFQKFDDKGWFFSKALGLGVGGYLTWGIVCTGLVPFRAGICISITLAGALISWILFLRFGTPKQKQLPDLTLCLKGEFLFLLLFLFWTWCAGFRPQISGTEKPMDYGFMAAMMRSDTLPARDMWYSEGVLNYYYGGQYYAVYLTKLTLTRIEETYNLMRMLVAAYSFVLPWSLVRQAVKDRMPAEEKKKSVSYAWGGGLLAGALVSLSGNGHYLLYGLFGSVFKLSGYDNYWFPDSTRFIGHNPVTEDQCIHEFPSYSFVLGDLHAHVVNLFLVLLFIGLMYAWFQCQEGQKKKGLLAWIAQPQVLMAGVLIGIYQWTNYWDFIIYLTVFLFSAVCIAWRSRTNGLAVVAEMLTVLVLQKLIALPFTLKFDSMFKGVGICINHTPPYQFLILWCIPMLVSLLLALAVVRRTIHYTDVFWVMMAVCGLGLIFIPELVYVKDIYGSGYARSNTMFKLTYQSYVMFGLMMAYTCIRILADGVFAKVKRWLKLPTALCLILLWLSLGYSGYAISCWYGNILDRTGYKGLDSLDFMEEEYPEDAAAIRWLDANLEGQPVVLEAPGDSYSDHCRVSAFTGLPTVAGWHVHEWLWRDDPDDIAMKIEDVRQIYTNEDREYVFRLVEEYDVSYIFIGSCEREEYGEYLQEELLRSLGTVVFDGQALGIPDGAVVIQVTK